MALEQYTIILASDIGNVAEDTTGGSLFSRVNKVRQNHAAVALQAGNTTAYNALNPHYNTNVVTEGNTITPDLFEAMKTIMTHLYNNSPYITTDYGTGIITPAVGTPINLTSLDVLRTAVTNVEGVVAQNTAWYSSGYYASNYGYRGSYDSGNYSYDGTSYDSGNYSYDGSSYNGSGYNGSGYNGSYNGSRFCGTYSSGDRGYCRGAGFR